MNPWDILAWVASLSLSALLITFTIAGIKGMLTNKTKNRATKIL